MSKFKFIKKIEQMISPKDIATLQTIAPLNKYVPKKLQTKIITSSADKNPYMGFVVEPYSFFLCYEIIDLEYAQKLLPDGFELIKTKIFDDDEPKYYCIFTCYNLHTSAFYGTRLEVNIIAKSNISNLTSWVIIDCDTNTLSHDAANGLVSSTTENAILTTDFDGNIIVDIDNKKLNRSLIVNANTKTAKRKNLSYELWLEGNLSIGYGREISNNSAEVFSLMFDPKEVISGYSIPMSSTEIDVNSWYPNLFKAQPEFAVYFPFAQHFLSDSPGHLSSIYSEEQMLSKMNNLDLDNIPDYSAKPLRKIFKVAFIFNLIISYTLLIALLILLF
ncbi:MAG: hypothetical protein ACRCUP_00605 [Mycoplasmatales bacterium]